MKEFEYDLLAIGGGTAGLVSAAGARYLGVRSAIVERQALGGDCLWTGCVPSKALIASARLAHAMRNADELGLSAADPAHAFSSVLARMRAARGVVEHHDDPERFRGMGVAVHFGAARFTGRNTVEVEGVGRVRSKRIMIATGAVPVAPPIPGLDDVGYLDHHTVFDAPALGPRVTVLGGGPIGLELAQVFRRIGLDVTVVEMLPTLLAKEDPELAGRLRTLLEGEGIRFRLATRVASAERSAEGKVLVTEDGARIVSDDLFVATGRRPATDGLELDRAGVERDGPAVRVDARLRTTNRSVWAAGDVTGGMQFTHVADHMAKTVLRNALVPGSSRIDYGNVPRVTYTDPELAHVGLSEKEAHERGAATFAYEMSDLDRAIVDGATRGVVKIFADGRGRILGASILASHAGELILPLVLARTHGLRLSQISGTIFPYPTLVEGVKRASDAYQRTRLDGAAGTVLRKVVSWLT